MSMAVRSIIVAINLEHSVDGNTGGISRHQHNTLLLVNILVASIRLAHDDVNLATGVTGTTRPPLGSIEDILIAFAANVQLDVCGVGRSNIRLRHEESRANLAVHEGLEPLVLLGVVAVLGEHLHVTGVGGGAVAGLGGGAGAAEPFGHEAVLEVGPSGRFLVVALGEEHVPETELLGLFLELFDDLRVVLPSVVALAYLGFKNGVGSGKMLAFTEEMKNDRLVWK